MDEQIGAVARGDFAGPESMLLAQANTLDVAFHGLMRRATYFLNRNAATAEMLLRLALKAQSQSRTSIETLAEVKNPRAVAFVKQANISNGPQQVNNTTAARGNESEQNRLLEPTSGERLDTRETSTTGGDDKEVATVGKLQRGD